MNPVCAVRNPITQMITLFWHQMGIPALCYFVGKADCYPSSGDTVKWAYLLLGFMLGAGPIMLRSGPGANDGLVSRLLAAFGRK